MGGNMPHHLHTEEFPPYPPWNQPASESQISLCEPIPKGGRTFFPLVRNSLGLTCGLKILFLRNAPRGKIIQSGDIDGRIKTLLDALSIPRQDTPYVDAHLPDPVYCLLEDDALITGIAVRTEQLLSRPGADEKEVRLMIEVDVRISHPRSYNALFLGD